MLRMMNMTILTMLRLMLRTSRKMMMLRNRSDPKTGNHDLCEPAKSKCAWTFHKSHFMRKFTSTMPRAKTGDHSLCEPARSKCRTFHKSHFAQEFTSKKSCGPKPRPRLCASLRNRNALGHFTRATLCQILQAKNATDQERDPHFARACPVETFHKSNFTRKLTGKMPGP